MLERILPTAPAVGDARLAAMCGSYFSILPRGPRAHKEIGERNAIWHFCACGHRAGFAALRDVPLRFAHSAQEIKWIERSKLRTQPAFDCFRHRR
jgi:hypothetical protein